MAAWRYGAAGTGTQTFSYDGLRRVTSATLAGGLTRLARIAYDSAAWAPDGRTIAGLQQSADPDFQEPATLAIIEVP